VGRQQRASQKPYRNVDTDNPLSGADEFTSPSLCSDSITI
jgi:hypothetical protein